MIKIPYKLYSATSSKEEQQCNLIRQTTGEAASKLLRIKTFNFLKEFGEVNKIHPSFNVIEKIESISRQIRGL